MFKTLIAWLVKPRINHIDVAAILIGYNMLATAHWLWVLALLIPVAGLSGHLQGNAFYPPKKRYK